MAALLLSSEWCHALSWQENNELSSIGISLLHEKVKDRAHKDSVAVGKTISRPLSLSLSLSFSYNFLNMSQWDLKSIKSKFVFNIFYSQPLSLSYIVLTSFPFCSIAVLYTLWTMMGLHHSLSLFQRPGTVLFVESISARKNH